MRPFVIVATFLLSAITASAQEPIDHSLKSFLADAATIRELGPMAHSALQTMAREEPELALPILVLRRQADRRKQTLKADAPTAKFLCSSWIAKARALSRLGVDVSGRLDVLSQSVAASDKAVLLALDQSIHVGLAMEAIKKFLGRGTYRGMFADLKNRAPKISRAFLYIFSDRIQTTMIRAYAAEGIAELCPKTERADFRKEVNAIHSEEDETSAMKDTAMILLARLGDRKLLDARLLKNRNIVVEELRKDAAERNLQVLLLSYQQSADLLQRVGDIKTAAEVNTDYLRLVLSLCTFASQNPEARGNIAGQCYDFACLLSQLKRIDFALYMLETSFNWGFNAFDWAVADKDLSQIRKDSRFKLLLESWRSGETKPGSVLFDDKTYMKKAGRAQAKSQPSTKPTSRPRATTRAKMK